MESQHQNLEFRINPENFHPYISHKPSKRPCSNMVFKNKKLIITMQHILAIFVIFIHLFSVYALCPRQHFYVIL